MYCSKCGEEIKDGYLFCDKCGTKVEIPQAPQTEEKPEETTQEVVEEVTPKQEGVTQDRLDEILGMLDEKEEKVEEPIEEKVEEKTEEVDTPVVEEPKVEEPVVEEPIVQEPTPVVEPQPVEQKIIQEPVTTIVEPGTNRVATEVVSKPIAPKAEEPKTAEVKNDSPLGLISMIIGIACIPLAFFIRLWTIPIAIAGIIVGACHKGKDSKKTAGIALSAASIPLAVIAAIVAGIFGLVGGLFNLASDTIKEEIKTQTQIETKSLVYKGDGYTLNYSSKWSVESSDDEDGDYLEYKNQEDYLVPIDSSAISEIEEFEGIDVATKDGRNKVYTEFYNYWVKEANDPDLSIKENTNFKLLTGDIYYATFAYEDRENDAVGHYVIIVSKDSNAIITMLTICSEAEPDDLMDEVEILLKTIKIDKQ